MDYDHDDDDNVIIIILIIIIIIVITSRKSSTSPISLPRGNGRYCLLSVARMVPLRLVC